MKGLAGGALLAAPVVALWAFLRFVVGFSADTLTHLAPFIALPIACLVIGVVTHAVRTGNYVEPEREQRARLAGRRRRPARKELTR